MNSGSNTGQWKRLQLLFDEAVQLDESARAEFIRNSCEGDKQLEEQLQLLLKGDDVADDVLGGLTDDITAITSSLELVGKQISQYNVLQHIGGGGMGDVYLAEDTDLNRKVALKFLPLQLANDELLNKRFMREAQSAATLSHPNIVTIHETSNYQGRAFIAMEYIEGDTLHELIKAGSLSPKQKLEMALQLCSALENAHESGIIHRDVKPGNIMIDQNNSLRLVDFGLVSLMDQDKLTRTGALMGTPAYMSPEQIDGKELTQASDIFSVGSVLHELFSGEQAFQGDSPVSTINAVLSKEPEPLPTSGEIPKGLGAVLEKALQKNLNNRFQSISELITELNKIKDGRYSEVVTSARKIRRIRDVIIAVAVVSLAMLFFFFNPWSITLNSSDEAEVLDNSIIIMYLNNLPDPSDTTRTAEIISSLLMTDLGESRYIKTVDRNSLNDALRSQGLDRRSTLSLQQASQVALEVGAKWFVTGNIVQIEPHIILATQITESTSGTSIPNQNIVGSEGESIYSVVDRLTDEIRLNLKVPDIDHLRYELSISQLTTSSLPGYRSYLEGLEHLDNGDKHEAGVSFLKALQYDSSFAMAYFYLSDPEDYPEHREMIDSAMKYIAHTSSKEKHTIRGASAFLREDDPEKQQSEYSAALALSPFDKTLQEAIKRSPEQTSASSMVDSSTRLLIAVATLPDQNELNVQANTNISITFDIDMDETTINDSTIVVSSRHTGIHLGTINYDGATKTVTLDPDNNFVAGEQVSVVLTSRITSLEGDRLAGGYNFGFTVATRSAGGLRPQITYPITHNISHVNAGNLDGDLDIDLVVSGVDTISILMNDGTGSFRTDSIIVTSSEGTSNLVDLDNDSDLDMVTISQTMPFMFIRLNDGAGSFGNAIPYATGLYPLTFTATGDWNNDGYPDLAVPNFFGKSFSIFINNGDGTMAPRVDYHRGVKVHGLCGGDFDEDGDLDIAVSDHYDSLVTIYHNNGTGLFAVGNSFPVDGWPMKILSSDLNNDGHLDIASVNYNFSGGCITILLGDGLGNFVDSSTTYIALRLYGLDAGDVDGDGNIDLISATNDQPLALVLKNPGDGVTFTSVTSCSVGGDPIWSIERADINSDGILDIITPNSGSRDISILFNTAPGLEIISTSPTSNQIHADPSTSLTITFGNDMNPQTINNSTFLVNSTSRGIVSGKITYDGRSRTATLKPDQDFISGERVFVILTSGIISSAGVPLVRGYSFSFSIAP